MAVLPVIFLLRSRPESFIMTLSGDEFLLEWNSIGWMPEDFEDSKASSQCGLPVEPLVMNGRQGTVAANDLCNDEQLMALTHLDKLVQECEGKRGIETASRDV